MNLEELEQIATREVLFQSERDAIGQAFAELRESRVALSALLAIAEAAQRVVEPNRGGTYTQGEAIRDLEDALLTHLKGKRA